MTLSRSSTTTVPMTETMIEPIHPRPLQKKTNTPPRYPVPANRYASPSSSVAQRDLPTPFCVAQTRHSDARGAWDESGRRRNAGRTPRSEGLRGHHIAGASARRTRRSNTGSSHDQGPPHPLDHSNLAIVVVAASHGAVLPETSSRTLGSAPESHGRTEGHAKATHGTRVAVAVMRCPSRA